jgi:hypothetical protein
MNTIGESWTLYVNGRQQCGNIDKGIMNAVFQPIMIAKWTQLFRLTPDQASQCDWTLFFRSHSVHHKFRVNTLIKYNARLLPVGSNLKRRRHSDTSQCFHCEEDETHEHLVQCSHPELTSLFEDLMVELYQWLQDYTSDRIAKELVYIARYFRNRGQENIDITMTNDRVRTQISLGLRAFYGGLWTVHWSQEQRRYLRIINSRRDPDKWLTHIIHKVQSIPLMMWDKHSSIKHQQQKNHDTTNQQVELNQEINTIFQKKTHDHVMAHCDLQYFRKHSKEKIKTMTIKRKTNWIAGANLILIKYKRVETPQEVRFMSYFQ